MANNPNARQVNLYHTTVNGNYKTLKDYVDGKEIHDLVFSETVNRLVGGAAPSGVNFIDLGSDAGGGTVLGPGGNKIARCSAGTVDSTTVDGGIVARAGVLGSALLTTTLDTDGALVNAVSIRVAGTHAKLKSGGFEVFGLLHTDGSDGDTVALVASSNLQMSFVTQDASGTIAAVNVSDEIEFTLPTLYSRRYRPTVKKIGGVKAVGLVAPTDQVLTPTFLRIAVTTDLVGGTDTIDVANKVIAGGGSGAATFTGDAITGVTSQAAWGASGNYEAQINGIGADKASGEDLYFSASGILQIPSGTTITAGEIIEIRAFL